MRKFELQVNYGIATLDARGPKDWRTKIKPEKLDIKDPNNCILGQIFGGYDIGLQALGFDLLQSIRNGFSFHYDPNISARNAVVMKNEWLKQLTSATPKK